MHFTRFFGFSCGLLFTLSSLGQIPLNGALSDGVQGPLGPGVYHCGSISVAAGSTLTIQAGAILKFNATGMSVSGTLVIQGTASEPVIFTGLGDDSAGGDTNNNGPSSASFASWINLALFSGAVLQAQYLEVRWTGGVFQPALTTSGDVSLQMSHCHFLNTNAQTRGMTMSSTTPNCPLPHVANCTFSGFQTPVLVDRLRLIQGFHNNSASSMAWHKTIETQESVVNETVSLQPSNMMEQAILLASGSTMTFNAPLTLAAGVILKLQSGQNLVFQAPLHVVGTASNPIYFTTVLDDAIGANVDNAPSTGSVGALRGIHLVPGSEGSIVENTHFRWGGWQANAAVNLEADVCFRRNTVFGSINRGIGVASPTAQPIVEENLVSSCLGSAIAVDRLRTVMTFRDNTLTGNGFNRIEVVTGAVDHGVVLHRWNLPQGVATLAVTPLMTPTSELTLNAGVILKFSSGDPMVFDQGRLTIRGTKRDPVVFTSLHDDAMGGDSDNAGPTIGLAGWRGAVFGSGLLPSEVTGLRVRNAGGGLIGGISLVLDAANLRVRNLWVENGYNGIYLYDVAGAADNWLVTGCNTGLTLLGDNADIRHATVTSNFIGIHVQAGWSGTLRSSISFGNGHNFLNLPPGRLFDSNGDQLSAGTNGNIFADPAFVNPAAGDFRLGLLSPCVDAADETTAILIAEDLDNGSRLTDSTLTGQVLPDMGAYEQRLWSLDVLGEPRLGSVMSFVIQGPANALGVIVVGAAGAADQFFPNYGWLLIGTQFDVLLAGLVLPGEALSIPMPTLPFLAGFPFQVQGLAVLSTNTSRGAFTQRYQGMLEP